MRDAKWPKPPIRCEDLPLIRALLTTEDYADLVRRLVRVLPDGPLVDHQQAFARPSGN